ncbi:BREX-1 system adenine-specific DNA-methyltransferase PglX [Neobacillus vireti]|uniref:BREX-1 system adenine-specific DNA-methyltransferase PglX n=1 Tax=Neobacillus vireti TaxID=220686 RepID=UPI003000F259
MNKSALKTFATSARKELLKKVEAKAMKIGITEDTIKKADVESSDAIFIDGRQLLKEEKIQRDKLISRINQIGFKQVMEEVAYTWFNRFTALRFMEVNDYLPSGVRVLSSSNPNSADPDMINEALELDLEVELDKEHIYNLKLNNETEELFKYLIIKHCNDLNRFLPFMFKTIDDYTEILFPEGLLAKDSFIRQMIDIDFIPADNWQKVEVIGWLYQYYIAEEKDRVIQAKKKYKTEEIPFATQLFTPDWIVRYMVQNSLGRYWVESHPEHRDLLGNWEFYLENPNPEPDFEEKLAPYINKELKVEDIKCFDPAMGSGHILVYMFDVLYEIYSKCGYMEREIPRLIIEKNLYGLDIDDRAYQLACFSVVMKALEYNSRFFRSIEREGLTLNLASFKETNELSNEDIEYLAGENIGGSFDRMKSFLEQFKNAKSIGSLIKIEKLDKEFIKNRIQQINDTSSVDLFEHEIRERTQGLLDNLLKQAIIIEQKYDVLITNPPYLANKYLNNEASDYLAKNYSEVKADMFSAFIENSFYSTKRHGLIGFMTPFVWMFILSYEKLRQNIINNKSISSLVQLEYSGFNEATVPICTFTMRNYHSSIKGEYIRLSDFRGAENQPKKTLEAVQNPEVSYRYSFDLNDFSKIPGNPIAYWVSDRIINIFQNANRLDDIVNPKKGLTTANDAVYVRLWTEVSTNNLDFNCYSNEQVKISNKKWFPLNKGGEYRKWYGNNEYVVNWGKDGSELKNYKNAVIRNSDYYFKECITWNDITSKKVSFRYKKAGQIFNDAGPSIFGNLDDLIYLLGFGNSIVSEEICKLIAPTIHYGVGQIAKLPIIINEEFKEKVLELTYQNISISKTDWDSFETSWDFECNPLVRRYREGIILQDAFNEWKNFTDDQFELLKNNEEELNRIFINIYGLQNDYKPEVNHEDLTIRNADLERDIRAFISYSVGCMFGRYSLDKDGLIYAGGEFEHNKYELFKADKDNILPVLPGTYFEDDIVSRFIEFVQVTFGEGNLFKNLEFIADILGKKKGETAKETIRRYFLNDFFKDHVKTYQKRPIYWLFTSGKQKAFNCLIYMHRYDKTTLSRIRTDYLHEYQIRLDAEKKDLLSIIEGDYSTKEISNAKKELKVLDKKIEELKEYDELLHHMADMQIEIDLDEGVVQNYEMFKGLVAKI